MDCPHCDGDLVAFTVPDDLSEYAESDRMTICTVCLRTTSTDEGEENVHPADDADFSAVHESFPDGRAGVAFALAVGKLGSLALERAAIEDLLEEAEEAGADVWMTLDRLATAGALEPHFDVARRTEQLQSF
jgi:hypothetical protein